MNIKEAIEVLKDYRKGEFVGDDEFCEAIDTVVKELEKPTYTDAERFDAEDWLNENKDIWNHPIIGDRLEKNGYEVADLMAEFANWYYKNNRGK